MIPSMMRSIGIITIALALAAVALFPQGVGATDHRTATGMAVDWIVTQQTEDGGFPGFDGNLDPASSADVALALAAAGVYPGAVGHNGTTLLDYLESIASEFSATTNGATKLLLAAVASGADPHVFGDVDLIEQLTSALDPETGLFSDQLYVHALATIALAGAGVELDERGIDPLIDRQQPNGGWAFMVDAEPEDADLNTTAIVVQALVAAGIDSPGVLEPALDYLESGSVGDGSYMYAPGIEDPPVGDANSTALVVQARLSLGLDDETTAAALDALTGFINESGALRYRDDFPDDNLLATVQAIPSLAGQSLLISPYRVFLGDDLLETARSDAEPGESGCDYHPTTAHNVCHGFRDAWHAGGGLPVYGYPLTEEFDVLDEHTGERVTVQYFERARFEYRWLNFPGARVQIASLGDDSNVALIEIEPEPTFAECEVFEAAEFEVCGPFLEYWNAFGGADVFGMPLSAIGEWDGLTVQQFEFARFEWHDGVWPERYDVLLGRIGAEELRRIED